MQENHMPPEAPLAQERATLLYTFPDAKAIPKTENTIGIMEVSRIFQLKPNRFRFLATAGTIDLHPIAWNHPQGPYMDGARAYYDRAQVEQAALAFRAKYPKQPHQAAKPKEKKPRGRRSFYDYR